LFAQNQNFKRNKFYEIGYIHVYFLIETAINNNQDFSIKYI